MHPSENEIVGRWVQQGDSVVEDEQCKRIHALIEEHFEQLAVSPESGSWETLFVDHRDGRYWERTYPQSHMHGGGPPKLVNRSDEEAHRKYGPLPSR